MSTSAISPEARAAANKFLEFVNSTGSPYHAVAAARKRLEAAGFERLNESVGWDKLVRGSKYYVTRNHSSILSFIVGEKFEVGEGGFVIAAAHTDSPCLRVRPQNDVSSEGYRLTSVETYGGGLWHTWFDRGLGLAGKVVTRNEADGVKEHLVRVPRPIFIIPNLAIHLQSAEERSSFKINAENHLRPILCSEVKRLIAEPNDSDGKSPEPLRTLLAAEVKCAAADILDFDICLMDATEGRLAGVYEEFVESGRLDNLTSTWASVEAICECSFETIYNCRDILVAAAWDHEEVGSVSYSGADSVTLERWLKQILLGVGGMKKDEAGTDDAKAFGQVMERSFFISADCAHGIHPNYADKHQALHKPLFHKGIIIKENCNQRYASHAVTMAMTRKIAEMANPPCPVQNFVVRNDSPCGSTIGSMSTARLGMRGVDVGLPQWSMHSIRETCAVDDVLHLKTLISSFYSNFSKVDISSTVL